MPYRSRKQRAWMHIHRPRLAEKWDRTYGGKIRRSDRTRNKRKGAKR